VAIRQKNTTRNPRSTVVLPRKSTNCVAVARIGRTYCLHAATKLRKIQWMKCRGGARAGRRDVERAVPLRTADPAPNRTIWQSNAGRPRLHRKRKAPRTRRDARVTAGNAGATVTAAVDDQVKARLFELRKRGSTGLSEWADSSSRRRSPCWISTSRNLYFSSSTIAVQRFRARIVDAWRSAIASRASNFETAPPEAKRRNAALLPAVRVQAVQYSI